MIGIVSWTADALTIKDSTFPAYAVFLIAGFFYLALGFLIAVLSLRKQKQDGKE